MNFLYLHGFASSPQSRKALFFKEKIELNGWHCSVPDLNVPSFEELSLAAQIALSRELISRLNGKPFMLIGSSMGGLLAALLEQSLRADSSRANLEAIILLAPGFGITKRWPQIIGQEGMDNWKRTGFRPFFHYAANQELPLHFAFAQDLEHYQTDNFKIDIPTIVFHGVDDQTVPIEHARQFAQLNQSNKLVQLVELNDGHELANSLDTIWLKSYQFTKALHCQRY
ncbi:alpha/beta fold hydrolase [bacterium]|nr:alpha/beta fold hydrolase [bacterium]MBP9809427.1 alpha/beta fold hydrolase [bacterium]